MTVMQDTITSELGGEVEPMLIVTTESIPGYRIVEAKGEVFGLVVRSRGFGGDVKALAGNGRSVASGSEPRASLREVELCRIVRK